MQATRQAGSHTRRLAGKQSKACRSAGRQASVHAFRETPDGCIPASLVQDFPHAECHKLLDEATSYVLPTSCLPASRANSYTHQSEQHRLFDEPPSYSMPACLPLVRPPTSRTTQTVRRATRMKPACMPACLSLDCKTPYNQKSSLQDILLPRFPHPQLF